MLTGGNERNRTPSNLSIIVSCIADGNFEFNNTVARSVKSYRDGESIFPSYLRNYGIVIERERIVSWSVATIEKIFWMDFIIRYKL